MYITLIYENTANYLINQP